MCLCEAGSRSHVQQPSKIYAASPSPEVRDDHVPHEVGVGGLPGAALAGVDWGRRDEGGVRLGVQGVDCNCGVVGHQVTEICMG
jgi:hypothetical protein